MFHPRNFTILAIARRHPRMFQALCRSYKGDH